MMRGKLRHLTAMAYILIILLNMQYITNSFNFNYSWAQVPPLAVATVDQPSVNEHMNVTLDGSASSSPEGRPISFYNWSEVDTNQPVFLVRNGSKATFQAPNVTGLNPVNYTFRLIVTDANGMVSTPSDVNVTVSNVNETTIATPPTSPLPVELPPHTIGTSPANGSINIPTKADKLTATFDQNIDSSSAKISLKDTTGNEIPADFTSDGPSVTIIPKSDLSPGTNYTVSIDQISGKGKTNVGSVIFGFTTVPEEPPTPTSENHPPEAQSQQVTTETGKPVDIALGAIDNDTGDSLTAEIVTPPQPNSGSLGQIDQNTGNVTFTPAASFSGNDSFTFKVIDNHQAESNVGTITITVTPSVPLTQPPPKLIESVPRNGSSDVSTTIDKIEATFDDKVNIGSATISLKDDSGKDIQITTNAQDSKVIIIPQSKLSPKTHYTILFDQIKTENKSNPGSTSFSFTTSATTNNPPLIEKLDASPSSAKVGGLVMLSVADPDLKDENLSSLGLQWQQTSGLPTVNLTLSSDNKTASFTAPEVKQNTPLTFKLTATDEENQTASKDVTVNVIAPPPNRPPEITVIANATDPKSGQGIEMKASIQDEQPLSVNLTWQQTSGLPTVNLTLSSDNKTASFTAPEVKQNTPLTFKLTATDEENQTASKDVTVNVIAPPPNRPPEISVITNATDPKSGQGIEMKASIQDEQPLSVNLTWQQTSGLPTVNLTLSSDNKTASFTAPEVKQNTPLI